MTKDELIARLRSLGEQLNRDVSLTGTKEELALRVAELKEELDDTDETAGQDTPLSRENVLTGHENEVGSAQPDTVILDTSELVTVVALVKLHTDALHATRDEPVAFVLPGTAFRVSAGVGSRFWWRCPCGITIRRRRRCRP
ncbi:DNA-packaging protein FI [Klebsiella pneumoniae]|uniref:DNA-packaging protein FI n=1 Tax=Klebsiella pneumoniae TaxID=573 RepID=UPI001E3BE43C|nr:DNA-packaging protein FI [Klebsiella pneumoniae]